jgi:hypothetical protein
MPQQKRAVADGTVAPPCRRGQQPRTQGIVAGLRRQAGAARHQQQVVGVLRLRIMAVRGHA